MHSERIIQNHLYEKFPGIQLIAQEVGMLETKLKKCFKTFYGSFLLQYFQSIQIKKAAELISTRKYKIAEIAEKLGYQNASKFAAVFKKHFGVQPSTLIKEKM